MKEDLFVFEWHRFKVYKSCGLFNWDAGVDSFLNHDLSLLEEVGVADLEVGSLHLLGSQIGIRWVWPDFVRLEVGDHLPWDFLEDLFGQFRVVTSKIVKRNKLDNISGLVLPSLRRSQRILISIQILHLFEIVFADSHDND